MTLTTHWLWQKVKCRYNLWPQSNIRNTSKVYLTFSFYLEVISYKNMIFLTGDYDPFLTLSLIKEWQILSQNLITVVCWNLSAWFGHNTKYKLREWLPSVFIPSGHVGGGRRIDAEHALCLVPWQTGRSFPWWVQAASWKGGQHIWGPTVRGHEKEAEELSAVLERRAFCVGSAVLRFLRVTFSLFPSLSALFCAIYNPYSSKSTSLHCQLFKKWFPSSHDQNLVLLQGS